MILPTSQRKVDVLSKFEYADHRRNEVMDELFSAKNESRNVKFLIHSSAEVVATARETFDYLGKDIVENYLLPNTNKGKLKKDHSTGKLKSYFPFHESQVEALHGDYHELKHISPALYFDLLNFVKNVAKKRQITDTLFNYGWFMQLKNMVNEKKHDRLVEIISEQNQEILVHGKDISMVIPKKQQQGWSTLSIGSDVQIKEACEYRFAYNNVEVGEFCLFAVKATEIVVRSFYANHFK